MIHAIRHNMDTQGFPNLTITAQTTQQHNNTTSGACSENRQQFLTQNIWQWRKLVEQWRAEKQILQRWLWGVGETGPLVYQGPLGLSIKLAVQIQSLSMTQSYLPRRESYWSVGPLTAIPPSFPSGWGGSGCGESIAGYVTRLVTEVAAVGCLGWM